MKYIKSTLIKSMLQALALGLLLSATLILIGPKGTTLLRLHDQHVDGSPYLSQIRSAHFHAVILALVALIALLPACNRESLSDKLFSFVLGIYTVILIVCSLYFLRV